MIGRAFISCPLVLSCRGGLHCEFKETLTGKGAHAGCGAPLPNGGTHVLLHHVMKLSLIRMSRAASSRTKASGGMQRSCGTAPLCVVSPRAIICAMTEAGKAVVRCMAESPARSSK